MNTTQALQNLEDIINKAFTEIPISSIASKELGKLVAVKARAFKEAMKTYVETLSIRKPPAQKKALAGFSELIRNLLKRDSRGPRLPAVYGTFMSALWMAITNAPPALAFLLFDAILKARGNNVAMAVSFNTSTNFDMLLKKAKDCGNLEVEERLLTGFAWGRTPWVDFRLLDIYIEMKNKDKAISQYKLILKRYESNEHLETDIARNRKKLMETGWIENADSLTTISPNLQEIGVRRGVSLFDAAMILNDNDRQVARKTKKRWQNSRTYELPKPIGKDSQQSQLDLYEPSALAVFLAKIGEHLNTSFLRDLRARARRVKEQ
jgi:hypothetical protein